jgi:hypothetical protein
MATRMTRNGVTTTKGRDQFQWEEFLPALGGGVSYVQWDYRDAKGELHSGVARNLADAEVKAAESGYRRQGGHA